MLISKLIIGVSYLSKSCLWAIVIVMFFWLINLLRRQRREMNYILLYMMTVYLLTLFMITGVIGSWSVYHAHNFQLIPFRDFHVTYFFLNVLIFVPMGIFVPAILQKNELSHKKYLGIGIAVSLCIEMIQYGFAGRLADIDDVIANTIGYSIGYLFFLFLRKLYQKQRKKQIGYGTYAALLSLLGFMFGVPYRYGMCLGDMLFVKWGLPVWSGNQGGALSFQGIHYSLGIYFLIQLMVCMLLWHNEKDYGAVLGKRFSMFGILFFGILIGINLLYS